MKSKRSWLTITILALVAPCVLKAQGPEGEYYTSLTQLTTHPEVDYYPTWSPDGQYIAFSSRRAGGNIWKVPSGGGEPKQLTTFPSNHPCWSFDGRFIAIDGGRDGVVKPQIVTADKGVPVRIVPDSLTSARSTHPCWSRDGASVAFCLNGDILTVAVETGEVNTIFHQEGVSARAFDWTGDSRFILASVSSARTEAADLWLLPVNGGEVKVLTETPGGEGNAKFSPKGDLIAFSYRTDDQQEIKVMAAAGGGAITIYSHAGFLVNPRWSPDGTRLAFAADLKGNMDIWIADLTMDKIRADLGLTGQGE